MSHAMAEVKINGFASVVTGIDLEDDGNPTADYSSRTADNLQESKVGLQWSADLDDGMRFVGQTVARGDSANGFVLAYDWAYFDFNVGDSGKLKVGRLRIPFYKYSDYLDVGYAYHWVTPPKSMYTLSFSNMDGIGYQQNFNTGGMDHSVNAVLGRYQGTLQIGGVPSPGNLENLVAVNYSATMGDHEFYIAYAQADTYIESASATTLSTLASDPNEVLINGDKGSFVGVGYKGSFGSVGVFAEASQVKVDNSIIQDSMGSYFGASYNMGEITYHVTYEMTDSEGKTFTGVSAPAEAGLNSAAKALGNRSSEGTSNTITLGARKDIGISSAVKIDLSSYTEDRFQDASATDESEQKALLLRIAVETMF
nr:porin [Bermanella sp. WJH001]MDJ1536937.1 porin [Bermanella sp. WJH001]